MIKLFRKIRQKILSENRFSKYLIYAIGEIILVVIGILIAIQINNWNENRKLKIIENASISALLSEFKLNPALQLYKRCGYQLYEEQETAITMVKTLHNDRLSTN